MILRSQEHKAMLLNNPAAPVLFLDFDGVLHPEDCEVDELFSKASLLCAFLHQQPGLSVVFSTSWRKAYAFDELVNFVTADHGDDLAQRFVGVTPAIPLNSDESDYRSRELECLRWREEHGHIGPWIALDDVHYWFSFGTRNAIFTDFRTGLIEQDIGRLEQRLLELCANSNWCPSK